MIFPFGRRNFWVSRSCGIQYYPRQKSRALWGYFGYGTISGMRNRNLLLAAILTLAVGGCGVLPAYEASAPSPSAPPAPSAPATSAPALIFHDRDRALWGSC